MMHSDCKCVVYCPQTQKARQNENSVLSDCTLLQLTVRMESSEFFSPLGGLFWATQSKGQHIFPRRRLKKRSHTPTTVSYFKAKYNMDYFLWSKESDAAFPIPSFNIYGLWIYIQNINFKSIYIYTLKRYLFTCVCALALVTLLQKHKLHWWALLN